MSVDVEDAANIEDFLTGNSIKVTLDSDRIWNYYLSGECGLGNLEELPDHSKHRGRVPVVSRKIYF